MIRTHLKPEWLLLLTLLLSACRQHSRPSSPEPAAEPAACVLPHETSRAIYHWRTVFAPDSVEIAFLRRHRIDRIYLRMFDVAVERNPETERNEAVPIATTRFAAAIPEGIEIVPTVYITLEALQSMHGEETEYAGLLVERLRAMASYNGCGAVREMQFDCDWTGSTRASYSELCRAARDLLRRDSIALSITVRLHQLGEEMPPADRGVLMLYNTGALKNPATRNSILDITDVRPYLRRRKGDMALDYAYPAFGWGVKFRNGKFQCIVTRPETEPLGEGDTLRLERPTADEVLTVKTLVESSLGVPAHCRIIYHLDNEQLKHYTDDEIAEIYADN